MKESLTNCPACEGPLVTTSYGCPSCSIGIKGNFAGCPFCRMPEDDRYFCLVFLQCEGNMKDVEKIMGISYPTIKNRLERIRRHLGETGTTAAGRDACAPPANPVRPEGPRPLGQDERKSILSALEKGDIDAASALAMLRGNERPPKE